MPEPAERFLFDLADAFAREVEPLADLPEAECSLSADAEIKLDDLFFAAREGVEGLINLVPQRDFRDAVAGKLLGFVLQNVEEVAVFALPERGVERQVGIAYPHGFTDFFFADLKLPSYFVDGRGSAIFLFKLALRFADLVDGARAVERQPDNTRLFRERLQNGLAYPPHRVGNELKILRFVEPLGGPDEAEVSLVYKIGKGQALVLIIAGHRNGEPEVCRHQFLERFPVTCMDTQGRLRFLFRRKGFVLADFLEIEGEGIFFRKKLVLFHCVRSGRGAEMCFYSMKRNAVVYPLR